MRNKVRGMRFGWLASVTLITLYPSTSAWGLADLGEDLTRREPAYLSHTLLDTTNRARAHVVSRFGLYEREILGSDFSTDSRFTLTGSVEAIFVLGFTDHFSVGLTIPVGFEATDGSPVIGMYGNTKLGFNMGWDIPLDDLQPPQASTPVPKVGIGGAIELYAPSVSVDGELCGRDRLVCDPMNNLRRLRALEPELWTNDAFLGRLRFHGDFRYSFFQFGGEFALAPGVTVSDREALNDAMEVERLPAGDFILLVDWALRIASLPVPEVEIYSEVGSSFGAVVPDAFPRIPGTQNGDFRPLKEARDLDTPVRLELGTRFHFSKVNFDPALFVSIDFVDNWFLVGLDLAGLIRSGQDRRLDRDRDTFDF